MLAKRPRVGMMEATAPALILRTSPIRALALLAALALSGCSSVPRLPTVVYIAVTANSDQHLDAELREDYRQRLWLLVEGFQQIYPRTTFQMGIYPEEQLFSAMARRSRAGLEPDLLFINGDTALRLLRAGLVDPFPADPALLRLFEPAVLARLRTADGRLAGLPILVQAQLSCYDRRTVQQPPRDLTELLSISASGQAVGLTVDPFNLLWTAGSLGALPALEGALQGRALSQGDHQSLVRWLAWLQNAGGQQRVTFFASQPETDAQFIAGRLSWIPCRSTALPMLRRRLGDRLGVAPLPDGPDGRASAVNRLRVMALGRHSSRAGRERALSFSRFAVNPLTQRTLTTGSQTVLPANRFVSVPVQSSQLLQTLEIANQQGLQTDAMAGLLHGHETRLRSLQNLFTLVVFGETTPRAALDHLLRILAKNR